MTCFPMTAMNIKYLFRDSSDLNGIGIKKRKCENRKTVSTRKQSWSLEDRSSDLILQFQYNHYTNMPMLYSAIFHGCKNDNFQMKNFDIFLIFAQNMNCGYALEPPQ